MQSKLHAFENTVDFFGPHNDEWNILSLKNDDKESEVKKRKKIIQLFIYVNQFGQSNIDDVRLTYPWFYDIFLCCVWKSCQKLLSLNMLIRRLWTSRFGLDSNIMPYIYGLLSDGCRIYMQNCLPDLICQISGYRQIFSNIFTGIGRR